MSTVAAQPNQTQTPAKSMAQRFGNGRYYAVQCEVFKDVQRIFNVPEDKAEAVAKAIASMLGRVFSRAEIGGYDRGLNKDGQMKSVWDFSQAKKVPMSPEFAMLRAIAYVNNAKANHVAVVASVDEDLADWLKGL